MKCLRVLCAAFSLSFVALGAWASSGSSQDALSWVQRMTKASKSINYSGVYQSESRGIVERSKVIHLVDAAGEHEKLQSLDGSSHEIIRSNEGVTVYLPQEKVVLLDRTEPTDFPNWIAFSSTLSNVYVVRLGSTEEMLGRKVQRLTLESRDSMRFSRELWLDFATGLLLKARTLDEKNVEVEKFDFEQIEIRPSIDRSMLQPQYGNRPQGWAVVNTCGQKLDVNSLNWRFQSLPPGYRLTSATLKPIRQNGKNVQHVVLSDGFASISVFVEAISETPPEKSSKVAELAVGIYKRILSGYQITTLGEVPMGALKKVAEAVSFR